VACILNITIVIAAASVVSKLCSKL